MLKIGEYDLIGDSMIERIRSKVRISKSTIALSAMMAVGAVSGWDNLHNQYAERNKIVSQTPECNGIGERYIKLGSVYGEIINSTSLVESLKDPVKRAQAECFTAARAAVSDAGLSDKGLRPVISTLGTALGLFLMGGILLSRGIDDYRVRRRNNIASEYS